MKADWLMLSGGREMAILTSFGRRIILRAKVRICSGMVAENITVCTPFLGKRDWILSISSEKPISSIRSASSRMKKLT